MGRKEDDLSPPLALAPAYECGGWRSEPFVFYGEDVIVVLLGVFLPVGHMRIVGLIVIGHDGRSPP
jgi:hypothetical protein